jgi:hypothetical protein
MMIPPSLLLIIYGVLAEQSIGKLFIAGVIPGFLMAIAFAVMIMLLARFKPELVFDLKRHAELAAQRSSARLLSASEMLAKLVPIAALVALVLGGLYSGFFTPTEAGGVGAFGAFVIAILRGKLGGGNLWRVLTETGAVSVGILILLVAAGFYSRMLSVAGVPAAISDLVKDALRGHLAALRNDPRFELYLVDHDACRRTHCHGFEFRLDSLRHHHRDCCRSWLADAAVRHLGFYRQVNTERSERICRKYFCGLNAVCACDAGRTFADCHFPLDGLSVDLIRSILFKREKGQINKLALT